jgi:aminoglycoside N3'-acetyltransferase
MHSQFVINGIIDNLIMPCCSVAFLNEEARDQNKRDCGTSSLGRMPRRNPKQ